MKCTAIDPVTLKECTRGEAHVRNGMAHVNGDTTWASTDLNAVSADQEFDYRIVEAITRRLARIRNLTDADRFNAYGDLILRVRNIIESERSKFESSLRRKR